MRAVLFDLDNTLTPRRACVAAFAPVFAAHFRSLLDPMENAHLARQFIEIDRGGYNPRRANDLRECLPWRTKPTAEALEAYWQQGIVDVMVPRPGLVELFDGLEARGFKIGVVTNGGETFQSKKVDRLGIRNRIQSLVISETAGCKKPDPRIFDIACQKLGVAHGECWFVGDHPVNDVLGATRCGMKGVWICDDDIGHEWPADEPPPSDRIETLLDLIDVVDGAA